MKRFGLGLILGLMLGGASVQAFEMYLNYDVNMDISRRTLAKVVERRCSFDDGDINCRSVTFTCSNSDYVYDEYASLSCDGEY